MPKLSNYDLQRSQFLRVALDTFVINGQQVLVDPFGHGIVELVILFEKGVDDGIEIVRKREGRSLEIVAESLREVFGRSADETGAALDHICLYKLDRCRTREEGPSRLVQWQGHAMLP
jgi:hypothetical protein